LELPWTFSVSTLTDESAASKHCQIGIATFIVGDHRPELDIEFYVDLEDYFLDELIEIHGIRRRAFNAMLTFFLYILVRRQEPDRK
jgi:hypothetical protein